MILENAASIMITESFPPHVGGVAQSAYRNAMMSREMLGATHVFTVDNHLPQGVTNQKQIDGLTISSIGPFTDDDLTLQLSGNIITHLHSMHAFDIYHGFYALHPGYLAVFYGRIAGKKSLVNIRGNDLDRGMFHYRYLPILLWTLTHADAISCVTKELALKCAALSGRGDIFYTPNSVDGTIFYPRPKDSDLLSRHNMGRELVLGVFGELRMKKGMTFILEAFRDLVRDIPSRLFIIGKIRKQDRPYVDNLLYDYKELKEKITFIDYTHDRDELCRFYNIVDIVLSPSLWEGMPNTVLEAMACGRIVISSDAGGARDIIEHGRDGFLLPVQELHRLNEAIQEVHRWDNDKKERMGAAAREKVVTEFSREQEMEGLCRVMTSLLD
jgi:L-malate glycosyltransferase